MKNKNPCTECIVTSMCVDYCDKLDKYVKDLFHPHRVLSGYMIDFICYDLRRSKTAEISFAASHGITLAVKNGGLHFVLYAYIEKGEVTLSEKRKFF